MADCFKGNPEINLANKERKPAKAWAKDVAWEKAQARESVKRRQLVRDEENGRLAGVEAEEPVGEGRGIAKGAWAAPGCCKREAPGSRSAWGLKPPCVKSERKVRLPGWSARKPRLRRLWVPLSWCLCATTCNPRCVRAGYQTGGAWPNRSVGSLLFVRGRTEKAPRELNT